MSKDTTSEHLRAELKSLADTLEEVLNSSADKSKEEVSKLRSKAEQALKESRYRLGETGDALAKQTREAAARADRRAQSHASGRHSALRRRRAQDVDRPSLRLL